MRFSHFVLILTAAAMLAWTQVPAPRALAESVLLKNGHRIDGKVTDNRATSGIVIIDVGGQGRITLRASQVDKIEASAPSDDGKGDHVAVTLSAQGSEFYGTRAIDGRISPESNDANLVLALPGGKITLPKSDVKTITKVEAQARPATNAADPAPAPVVRSIKTSHAVTLKNGRKLRGNVQKTADFEPVKLTVGSMGTLAIPRWQIAEDGIKEEDGTIDLPEEKKPVEAPAPKPPTAEEQKEQMKRELRAEILREILDELIEGRLHHAIDAHGALQGPGAHVSVSDEQAAEIQMLVYELGRQRTQNRVRAERKLRDMGSAVLPFLAEPARHPFELTRRAVQRIVRDVGDWTGAPLAIDALDDADGFVRATAGEALRKLLPSSINYSSTAGTRARLEAQNAYRALWDETVRVQLRESLLLGLVGER